MTLLNVMRMYSKGDKRRELLTKLRWPHGVVCPHCGHRGVFWLEKRNQFDCASCNYQFSVTTGTVFNDTHLALEKWFITVYLLCESRKGMSANQIKRTLGVSYKTAWYLCHRIRAAMKEAQTEKLSGTVEMDETYIGGRKRGGKRGRGSENKEIVIGIRQRGGDLRFFHASDIKAGTLAQYIKENVSEDVDVIMTDELNSYPPAVREAKVSANIHKSVKHGAGEYVVGDVHTNTVESAFSLLKRGIIGTWHRISAKHLPAYLDEMSFRFNRRNDRDLFIDTLRHMVATPTLTFEKLTKKSEQAA